MGDVKNVLITGATGFIGRSTVAEARKRKISVIAVARGSGPANWQTDPGIVKINADLSSPESIYQLRQVIHSVDSVIHAAAHMGEDEITVAANTVQGTKNLIAAMENTSVRIVLVSSISVYDTMRLSCGEVLDESTPLEHPLQSRSFYAKGKLCQEMLVREADQNAWLIRSGLVWGPGRSWNALVGFGSSKLFVQIGKDGELPIIHVDSLARSLIDAAGATLQGTRAVNALDDDRPTRARFMDAHRRIVGWPELVFPIPYGLWSRGVKLLRPMAANLPGLLREPVSRARLMPICYSNTAFRRALGGEDIDTFEDLLARSVEEPK